MLSGENSGLATNFFTLLTTCGETLSLSYFLICTRKSASPSFFFAVSQSPLPPK